MSRPLRYDDPLDRIWLDTAQRLGMNVTRSDQVYASWDGAGQLRLGTAETLDDDDGLAQMILHEICHALVEGPQGRALPDWGLDNVSDADLPREHACHRVQAALADRHGLRRFFAVTTDFRPYYDALPADPLAEDAPPHDPAIAPARDAFHRATNGPWAPTIERALAATAAVIRAAAPFAGPDSLLSTASFSPTSPRDEAAATETGPDAPDDEAR